MNSFLTIVAAILVAALGCWLSAHFIPAGLPRTLAQIASVIAGFGCWFGGLSLR